MSTQPAGTQPGTPGQQPGNQPEQPGKTPGQQNDPNRKSGQDNKAE